MMENYRQWVELHKLFSLKPEVRKSVQVYLENDLNLSQTARILFVHRNTLEYRFRMVLERTGIDLKTFEGAMTAYSVLKSDCQMPLYRFLICLEPSTLVCIWFPGGCEKSTVRGFLEDSTDLDGYCVSLSSVSVLDGIGFLSIHPVKCESEDMKDIEMSL